MLGKLISLLLHAKAGAISGVFLLGATGALVSVSAANGVTTITITEASPSPSASASHSASPRPSASPTATPTHTATPSPTASPSGNSPLNSSPSSSSACTDEAKALAFQVKRVDSAFNGFHTDLMKLRGQRDRATIEKADVMLKVIRQAAVKAIHATATQCKKHDDDEDEDEDDEDESHDAAASTTSLNSDRENDEDKDKDKDKDKEHGKKGTAPITFTGDAKSIADQAVAAMQVAFDTAKNAPVSTPKHDDKKQHDDKKHEGKSSEHRD